MTLGELISDVRVLLKDGEVPYHWSDDVIAGFIRDAICRLNHVRPASRYDASGRLNDIVWPNDLKTYEIPAYLMRWKQGFVYYASARSFEMDAADTVNQSLAVDFMAKAEARFLT